MALLLLFLIPLLLISSESLSLSSPQHPIAKSNCSDACGEVRLPFPFGVGRGCFFDDWYEIVCPLKNDTVTRPRLKKLNLEVISISLPQTRHKNFYDEPVQFFNGNITVSFPISYSNSSCAKNGNTRESVTFLQSPFVFSEIDNIFLAFGCDATARLQFVDDTSFIGCTTQCVVANNKRYSSCSCFGYCFFKVSSPSRQGYSVKFDQGDGAIPEHCGFASFVKETWFNPNQTNFYNVMNQGYVPVILEWGILNPTQFDTRKDEFNCITTNYINHNSTPLTQCACYDGYGGNPYLLDGCQDINECEDPQLQYEHYKCQSGKCHNKNGSYTCEENSFSSKLPFIGIYVGIAVAPFILYVLFIWFLYKRIKKRAKTKRKLKNFEKNGGVLLQQQLSSPGAMVEKSKLFYSTELEKATDNFNKDRILGQGGQGTVYKGMLSDGRIVAIKKSKAIDAGKVEMFINEVVILSQINHRNVVKLLGFCLESEIPLLVYEFIPNGTLYKFLHGPNEELPVSSWDRRMRIAKEVAGALSYLHSAASIPIYHRDIKSTNILLDEKYRAKIADFGTSRSVTLDQTHLTTLVQGTFGYLDPQYFQSNQFTDKSDVYSFGVVLLELLTGQKAVCSVLAQEGMGLASYFMLCMEQKKLFDILDPQVLSEVKVTKEEIESVAYLAKRCLNLNGKRRPTMKEVAAILEGVGKADKKEELSRCSSYTEASETDDDNNVVACASSSSMSDVVDPLIYGQTR